MNCCYCGKSANGAMLATGDKLAHVDCVIRKLNELLDPTYDGLGEPEIIIGHLAKTLKEVGEWLDIDLLIHAIGSSMHNMRKTKTRAKYNEQRLKLEALKRGEMPK